MAQPLVSFNLQELSNKSYVHMSFSIIMIFRFVYEKLKIDEILQNLWQPPFNGRDDFCLLGLQVYIGLAWVHTKSAYKE